MDGQQYILDVLDTTGNEDWSYNMHEQYMHSGQGFIILYDITRKRSFEYVETEIEKILRVKDISQFHPIIVVGNKIDRSEDREVEKDEVDKLIMKYGVCHIEASAKQRINVDETFFNVVERIENPMGERIVQGPSKKDCILQ